MKELLKKFLSGEGKLSLLLLEAKVFAEEYKDEALLDFINNELNGYNAEDLPDYRKIRAEIVGVIKDKYGSVVKKGAINFSKLSETVGFDLSMTYIVDGIGFIEDGLKNIDGTMAQRPIPYQLVDMLNKAFIFNNPNHIISSASHDFATSSVNFILTKVRQDVIIGLQKLQKQNEQITIIDSNNEITELKKNVFVTYAWDDQNHNDNVLSFVDFLIKNGYNASMDRKESQGETSINLNKMMIEGIQNSEKVIIILSPKYKERAEKFIGGVGTEFQMIVEELKSNNNKFIFVSFGDNTNDLITPTGIKGREVLNLKRDQDENEFNELFAKLQSKNIIQFSNVNETLTEVKVKEIKPFKL